MQMEEAIAKRWQIFSPSLDERQQRMWAAAEATALGSGGVTAVASATGMSRRRIKAGQDQLQNAFDGKVPPDLFVNNAGRRAAGAGRKPTALGEQELAHEIATLTEGRFAANKSDAFDWSTFSTLGMTKAIAAKHGRPVNPAQVSTHLRANGFYLDQEIRVRPLYAIEHREEQFSRVHGEIKKAHAAGQAVLLVHVERRILPSFRSDPAELATSVLAASMADTAGWKLKDPDAYTAKSALQLIRQWWYQQGQRQFVGQGEILLCINAFGSNVESRDTWIQELAVASRDLGVSIHNCFVPVGITRLRPLACQLATVAVIPDAGLDLARHKVMLSVMAKKSGGKQLRNRPRAYDQDRPEASRERSAAQGSFSIRPDPEMPDWNFSVYSK